VRAASRANVAAPRGMRGEKSGRGRVAIGERCPFEGQRWRKSGIVAGWRGNAGRPRGSDAPNWGNGGGWRGKGLGGVRVSGVSDFLCDRDGEVCRFGCGDSRRSHGKGLPGRWSRLPALLQGQPSVAAHAAPTEIGKACRHGDGEALPPSPSRGGPGWGWGCREAATAGTGSSSSRMRGPNAPWRSGLGPRVREDDGRVLIRCGWRRGCRFGCRDLTSLRLLKAVAPTGRVCHDFGRASRRSYGSRLVAAGVAAHAAPTVWGGWRVMHRSRRSMSMTAGCCQPVGSCRERRRRFHVTWPPGPEGPGQSVHPPAHRSRSDVCDPSMQ
jgi:hypothetical protein